MSIALEEVEPRVLCALLSNPESYKHITTKINNDLITQKQANLENINKASKIAVAFIIRNCK